MHAQITYLGGKSYWFGKHRFKLNKPVPVSDPAVIEHCENTAGFSVNKERPAVSSKKIRKVIATTASHDGKKRRRTI